MSITTEKYARTTFYVEAVQVTAENIEDVAKWCGGELKHETRQGRRLVQYIEVEVNNPMSEKQKRAFVGNWVLKAGTGFKVYTEKAFRSCFYKVIPATETADELWVNQDPLFETPLEQEVEARQKNLDHQIVTGVPLDREVPRYELQGDLAIPVNRAAENSLYNDPDVLNCIKEGKV